MIELAPATERMADSMNAVKSTSASSSDKSGVYLGRWWRSFLSVVICFASSRNQATANSHRSRPKTAHLLLAGHGRLGCDYRERLRIGIGLLALAARPGLPSEPDGRFDRYRPPVNGATGPGNPSPGLKKE